MDWNTIASIAEIVSAIAVVVTLLFLAVELRRNSNATQTAAVDALSGGMNVLGLKIVEDAEFAEIWMKGLANPDDMTGVEKVRFSIFIQMLINHYTTLKRHHDAAVLPENEWLAYSSGISSIMNSPGGKWASQDMVMASDVAEEFKKYENEEARYRWLGEDEERYT